MVNRDRYFLYAGLKLTSKDHDFITERTFYFVIVFTGAVTLILYVLHLAAGQLSAVVISSVTIRDLREVDKPERKPTAIKAIIAKDTNTSIKENPFSAPIVSPILQASHN